MTQESNFVENQNGSTTLVGPYMGVRGKMQPRRLLGCRKFHLFGLTLLVHDVWLLFFVVSGVGFGLFYVTSLLGRIWCGWACPYTVFLDHVFRRIERWIFRRARKMTILRFSNLIPSSRAASR